MKNILQILVGLLSPMVLLAQKSDKVKVYAYQQHVLPGVKKTTIDEDGSTKQLPAKTATNYFIYLEVPASKKVDPKHIWIKGKLYSVKVEKPNLPVVIYSTTVPGKKADTLVRQTSRPVMLLTLVPANHEVSTSSTVKKKIRANELAVHTIENGKNCYYYLPAIKMLDPVALQ